MMAETRRYYDLLAQLRDAVGEVIHLVPDKWLDDYEPLLDEVDNQLVMDE